MKRTLLAMTLTALASAAYALPPTAGTIHTFYDPVFEGVVVCDTIDQVRHIATAERPSDVFLQYLTTPNEIDEPTCAAVEPTGLVVDVMPIGVMNENGLQFHAYAVETLFGEVTAYVLYLEKVEFARI